MKNILIVDDDRAFLLSLTDGLRSHDTDFNVLTAGNGKEAVEVMESTPVDLVVTDIKMPEMSGFELLAYMSRHFKQIPVIVITAFGTPEIEKNLQSMGSTIQYLEKPLDFNGLVEKIYSGLQARANGYIKGISLPSILQVVEMEKESCTLIVKSSGRNGYLYFDRGQLIDAHTGNVTGETAAIDIAIWDSVEIEIDKRSIKRPRTISKSLDYIIIEGHRRKDEHLAAPKEDYSAFSAASAPLQINPPKENKMNIKKLNETIDILKEDLGDGLLATDIFSNSDGQSIAGFNSNPQACALFSTITEQMNSALSGAGFPILGRYYILDLADKKMVIVIPLGDFQWGILVDGKKVKLGLLLNISMPKIIDAFEEALTQ